jgi:hypothetical protein
VRFRDANVSLPGPRSTDRDSDGDEIGAGKHLTSVAGVFHAQPGAALGGDKLGIARHGLGSPGIDVDESERCVGKVCQAGQIGNQTGVKTVLPALIMTSFMT